MLPSKPKKHGPMVSPLRKRLSQLDPTPPLPTSASLNSNNSSSPVAFLPRMPLPSRIRFCPRLQTQASALEVVTSLPSAGIPLPVHNKPMETE